MISETPRILDANGRDLSVGAIVDDGQGGTGKVVEFVDADEWGWRVAVQWEGEDDTERFPTSPRDYRREGPNGPYVLRCDDVSRA